MWPKDAGQMDSLRKEHTESTMNRERVGRGDLCAWGLSADDVSVAQRLAMAA